MACLLEGQFSSLILKVRPHNALAPLRHYDDGLLDFQNQDLMKQSMLFTFHAWTLYTVAGS